MKIAVFHNALDNIGGAEIVGLTLARELDADVYTTNINRVMIDRMGFSGLRVHSIGKVPVNAPFRQQIAFHKFSRLDLGRKYDFYIIDGDWAMSAAKNNRPNLWYVHSPMREIWDLYEYTRENTVPPYARGLFDIWVQHNRRLNQEYLPYVERLVCNSQNTQSRIERFLGREAEVIHPPIETGRFHYKENGPFWLSVNRLITHKRIHLQLEAFRDMPDEKLVLVGSYERSHHFLKYAKSVLKKRPANVEIRSFIGQEELIALYARCRGFITTAKEEDFGMTAVEAMAAGKPVIAPNEGGYKESVLHERTGWLIDDIDKNRLKDAVRTAKDDASRFKEACFRRAQDFSVNRFVEQMRTAMAL